MTKLIKKPTKQNKITSTFKYFPINILPTITKKNYI